jgi:hypothetical protein
LELRLRLSDFLANFSFRAKQSGAPIVPVVRGVAVSDREPFGVSTPARRPRIVSRTACPVPAASPAEPSARALCRDCTVDRRRLLQIRSHLHADRIGRVTLKSVGTARPDEAFGVRAGVSLAGLRVATPAFVYRPHEPTPQGLSLDPNADLEFVVRVG